MKKIFAAAALAAVAIFNVNAEDEKFYIGGSLGFEHSTADVTVMGDPEKASVNSFSILPEFGFNINDKWAVGTTIGYDYKHFCGYKVDSNLFQFNPYARFTFFRTDNNLLSLFVDGGAGIGTGWVKYGDKDSDTAVTWNIGFRPGVAINLTDQFSVVAHLGFLGYEGANDTAYATGYDRRGGFLLNGNNLTLGFYFHF